MKNKYRLMCFTITSILLMLFLSGCSSSSNNTTSNTQNNIYKALKQQDGLSKLLNYAQSGDTADSDTGQYTSDLKNLNSSIFTPTVAEKMASGMFGVHEIRIPLNIKKTKGQQIYQSKFIGYVDTSGNYLLTKSQTKNQTAGFAN